MKSVLPGLVEIIVVVGVRVVTVVTVRAAVWLLILVNRRELVKVAMGVRGERRARTATFLALEHANKALLGHSKHGPNAVHQVPSQAPGLSTTLSPGLTVGSILNVGASHVKVAFGVVDKGNGDGVKGDGVSIDIKNGESYFYHVEGLIGRRWERHHLDGVSQVDGFGLFAIFPTTLDGGDCGGRGRREDLTVVGQEEAIVDGKFERL
jgi:hypothetical protein